MKHTVFDHFCDEYEHWFHVNDNIFQSELLALKQVIPMAKKGLDIGVGSGLFAEKLNIQYGVDPSEKILSYARKRNITVKKGVAEKLPNVDSSFDFVVFITSLCFVEKPCKAIQEAKRVLINSGEIIVAFLDRESPLGQMLDAGKANDKFYQDAQFYAASEVIALLQNQGFKIMQIIQTLTKFNGTDIEQPITSHGQGGFVIIKGQK